MFTKRSRILVTLLLLCLPSLAGAGQSAIPAAFADIGLGARTMGMGGAGSVGSGRAMDLFWNPAALAAVRGAEIRAMQTEQFGLVPTYLLTGAKAWRQDLCLALGLISSGDALLRENTLLLGAGRPAWLVPGLELGIALKLRHASFGSGGTGEGAVDGSALGAGLDIGLRGRSGPLLFGLFTELAGSQRAGLVVVILFLIAGIVTIRPLAEPPAEQT